MRSTYPTAPATNDGLPLPGLANQSSHLDLAADVGSGDRTFGEAATLARRVGRGCSFFNEHLLVENLVTGKRFTLGADAVPCHTLVDAAWNPSGTQLVAPR